MLKSTQVKHFKIFSFKFHQLKRTSLKLVNNSHSILLHNLFFNLKLTTSTKFKTFKILAFPIIFSIQVKLRIILFKILCSLKLINNFKALDLKTQDYTILN